MLVCVTFPLIWVGGLVTTSDAGMAVPDWPNTYGSNLFLYPWQTWVFGPWKLFIEHGHRLLGSLAGLITIALLVSVWRCDRRHWMRYVALGALALVVFQGVLGGLRVLFDERQLAKIHGCVGPAFLAYAVLIAVWTSDYWKSPQRLRDHAWAGSLHRLAAITAAVAYLQLVIGANLRHLTVDTTPNTFRALVFFHLVVAAVLAIHIVALTVLVGLCGGPALVWRPALLLCVLLAVQLVLGASTWVVKYSLPGWLAPYELAEGFTIQENGPLQTNVITAHVATGSLIVATAVQLALRSVRLVRRAGLVAAGEQASLKGAAA